MRRRRGGLMGGGIAVVEEGGGLEHAVWDGERRGEGGVVFCAALPNKKI